MGRAVIASINGLNFDEVWDRYHESGRDIINSIKVVTPANLKDSINGAKSISLTILYTQTF